MVLPLGPGKFYGSCLPRPRFYSDVKFSADGLRVDPPLPVLDPLLSWARDAHWSMGGLSFLRHRLQGRIEGNLRRLRVQQDRKLRLLRKADRKLKKPPARPLPDEQEAPFESSSSSDDEPEAEADAEAEAEVTPKSGDLKRRSARVRRLVGYEEDEADEAAAVAAVVDAEQPKKKRARKLGDEFDKVAGAAGIRGGSASPPRASTNRGMDGASPSGKKAGASRPSVAKTAAAPRRSGRISSPNRR